ncbi:MAG: TRAP transporter large permease subunit, partial [Pseudomonadota bacterium]|nr:TRAP transporter large permease subunit [Pseudomonadota bacterium]
MELIFLALLMILMAWALGSGFPVAFALPGSAIITIVVAAAFGYFFADDSGAYFAQGGPQEWLTSGVTNLRGVYWEVERDTLIAIPLFIFMGIMLQRSRIAEDLLVTMAQLFGPVPGGLGISVVFVGALLAATTGIVGATVVSMGLISLPAMLNNNYSRPLATGTIAASGTLGQIIPPSIVLIILADQLASATDQAGTGRKTMFKEATGELSMPSEFGVASTSAGEMFLGAFVPGLVLVALYMVFILVWAQIRPKAAPAVRYSGEFNFQFFVKVILILVPPLGLIFLVLGSIISGIATVNQAGAIGASGALFMAGYRLKAGQKGAYWPAILGLISLLIIFVLLSNFEINVKNIRGSQDVQIIALAVVATVGLLYALFWSAWRAYKIDNTLQGVMVETAKTTSLVFIILLGAAMLTAAFRAFGGEDLVRDFLNGMPGGFWAKFIIVMAVIFILGFFLDFIEIAVVVVPIIAPILLTDPSANVTAVWLGVMIGLNVQTSFLTPPFGFALFYLRGVAPAVVKTIEMYKGVIAFIILQLVAIGIVAANPGLVNYLPNRVSMTSPTAPPPRNPKLQYCIEEYVNDKFSSNSAVISQAVETARNLDTSYLPKNLSTAIEKSFDHADNAAPLLDEAFRAETKVNDNAVAYRPIHRKVRRIENNIRELDEEIKKLVVVNNRLDPNEDASQKSKLEAQISALNREQEELSSQIPTGWDQLHKDFSVLTKAELAARKKYRRTVDSAYSPVTDLIELIEATGDFNKLENELTGLRNQIANGASPEDMIDPLKSLAKQFGSIKGASKIKSQISKARRVLSKKAPKIDKAIAHLDKA